jgi:hypothetical protein
LRRATSRGAGVSSPCSPQEVRAAGTTRPQRAQTRSTSLDITRGSSAGGTGLPQLRQMRAPPL